MNALRASKHLQTNSCRDQMVVICSSQRRFLVPKRFQKAEREISIRRVAEARLNCGRIPDSLPSQEWKAAAFIRLEQRLLSGRQPSCVLRRSGWPDKQPLLAARHPNLPSPFSRPWAARSPFLVSTEKEQAGFLMNNHTAEKWQLRAVLDD